MCLTPQKLYATVPHGNNFIDNFIMKIEKIKKKKFLAMSGEDGNGTLPYTNSRLRYPKKILEFENRAWKIHCVGKIRENNTPLIPVDHLIEFSAIIHNYGVEKRSGCVGITRKEGDVRTCPIRARKAQLNFRPYNLCFNCARGSAVCGSKGKSFGVGG